MPPRRKAQKPAVAQASASAAKPALPAESRLPAELRRLIARLLLEVEPGGDGKAERLAHRRLALLNKTWRGLIAPDVYKTIDLRGIDDPQMFRRCAAALPGILTYVQTLHLGCRGERLSQSECDVLSMSAPCMRAIVDRPLSLEARAWSRAAIEVLLNQLGGVSAPAKRISLTGPAMEAIRDVHLAAPFAFRSVVCLRLASFRIECSGAKNTFLDTLASMICLKALNLTDVVVIGQLSDDVLRFPSLRFYHHGSSVQWSDAILEPVLSRCRSALETDPYILDHSDEEDEDAMPSSQRRLLSNDLHAIGGMSALNNICLSGSWQSDDTVVALRHCSASMLMLGPVRPGCFDGLARLRRQSVEFWPRLTRAVVAHRREDVSLPVPGHEQLHGLPGPAIAATYYYTKGMQALLLWESGALAGF